MAHGQFWATFILGKHNFWILVHSFHKYWQIILKLEVIWNTLHWENHRLIFIELVNHQWPLVIFNRRKFRSQTSDNVDRWKAKMGRVRGKRRVEKRRVEERRAEERRSEKRKSQKKEDAGARKSRKVAKHCVFPMIYGSGGSKSRLAKAAGAEPAGQMRNEKLHAVVAQTTFRSQNVQNTPAPDHSWKSRCRKSARRCGAKHISKSKCTKHTRFGPLLEVAMSKKCTPL